MADAKRMVDEMVTLPAGYTLQWSGQYEYMQRAKERLQLVVPATLLIIFLLLYFNFRSVGETLIVMLSLPFALVGGVLLMAVLGYNWSVATAIGFIALAGVAAEIAVILLTYLDLAYKRSENGGELSGLPEIQEAVREGANLRLRPVIMTAAAVIGGLVPMLWGHGAGASVMRRIAAPMIGGMVTTTVLTLLVIPAIYSLWKEYAVRRQSRRDEAELRLGDARPAFAGGD